MDRAKRRRLEAAGWHVGSARDFLPLPDHEWEYIDHKLGLAHLIRAERRRRRLTQEQLARLLKTSQSRVAKMEIADRSVSLDLLTTALFRLGFKAKQMGVTWGQRPIVPPRAARTKRTSRTTSASRPPRKRALPA